MSIIIISFDLWVEGQHSMPVTKPHARGAGPSKAAASTGERYIVTKWEIRTDTDKPKGELGTDTWWRSLLRYEKSVFSLYAAPPLVRIALVRSGVPAETLSVIARAMGIARDVLYETLGVPRATVERKIRSQKRLNQDQGERVMGIARLIGQVDQIVHESGNAQDFDAAHWVADWLDRPLPALGGRRPGTFMDTADGREIVSGLIAQVQSGAYA